MKTAFLTLGLTLLAPRPASATPTVVWHSDDVRGGDSVMLVGDGFDSRTLVKGLRMLDGGARPPGALAPTALTNEPASGSVPCTLLSATPQTLIVALPPTWAPGLYALWVGHGNEWSAATTLNRANAEWLSHAAAQPGDQLRVIGRILSVPSVAPRLSLRLPSGEDRDLPVTSAEKYALGFTIPADLPEGSYPVQANNGRGGEAGWGGPVTLTVRRRAPWPDQRFDVRQLGALGDGKTDDTAAVEKALAQAGANGGGIVYFAPGSYRLTKMLHLPERTVLQGSGQEEVTIFWPKHEAGDPEPEPAVIVGERNFGLSDLTLVFQIQQHGIVAPFEPKLAKKTNPLTAVGEDRLGKAGGVFINRCVIRHLRFAPRIVKGDRRLEIPTGAPGGVTVGLAGPNVAITDSDIVSWATPLMLLDLTEGLVSGNSIGTGRNGWYCFAGARNTIVENNRISGRDLEATGGGMNRGFPARHTLVHDYVAHNHYSDFYGGEREALTFDNTSPGDRRWLGRVVSAAGTQLTLASPAWEKGTMIGLQCLIVAGKGIGQYRTIVANDGGLVGLDARWQVDPDASSVADVLSLPRQVIAYANEFRDSSVGVQLYGASFDFVVDRNVSTRAGGFWGYATFYAPVARYKPAIWNHLAPMFFAQFLNNTVNDGFVYHQGPMTDGADDGGMIGLAANPWNPEGMPVAIGFGLVIRGNTLANHARIVVRTGFYQPDAPLEPVIHGALIEGNTLRRTPVGVEVGPGIDGVVVRHNVFTDVARPVATSGAGAASAVVND